MKIFISHKQEDGQVAEEILQSLKLLEVDAYLDILEGTIMLDSERLTEHIKKRLNGCTDILVVLSEKTKQSWWVPFEIGMASQKDMPIVNYLNTGVQLPEYLSYWPRLKDSVDIKKYVEAIKDRQQEILLEKGMYDIHKYASYESKTKKFYNNLKSKL